MRATPNPEGLFYLLFGTMLAFGLYLFIKGFRVYWQFRILQDTPETPIRSIAMGLVRVHGQAKGEEYLSSPVTNQPCFFYKVVIERWSENRKGQGGWLPFRINTDAVRFYLEDATDKVLIHPRGADLEPLRTAHAIIDGDLPEGLFAPSIERRKADPAGYANAASDAGVAYFTAGSSVPADQETVPKKVSVEDLKEKYALDLIAGIALAGSKSTYGGGTSGARFRVTEYCILRDDWYDAIGTCVENHLAKDEHDRNMIVRGKDDPTFIISWKGGKKLESSLDRRAIGYILGGAFLTLVSAALLIALFKFGS
jgi:hypothetical protein